jgi:EAL domain-containing protein (putative c-di-GMP-specific phosphodiesterase class I)
MPATDDPDAVPAAPDRRSEATPRDRRTTRDPLTGLVWFDHLMTERVRGQPGAVALIQLTNVDRHNDDHGYAAGDALLIRAARLLERVVRDDFGIAASVARVHGTRFAVLLAGTGAADRLGIEMRAIAAGLGNALAVGASPSPGVRLSSAPVVAGDTAATVLARLAKTLSAARALVRQLDVEAAMREGQVVVQYQPQFALEDDRLTGAEALARWRHPTLGDLGGAALFGAAHQAGLQTELSAHVWARVFADMADWPEPMKALRIAINVTASDLADASGATRILQMAARHGIASERLCIEVTEGAAMIHPEVAAASLAALRRAGMHTALDDFGTGHSGLAWLKNLPVDYIKIDSVFAADLGGAPRDEAVLRGVIDLARQLELDVLVEGIETEEQRARVAEMGCRWYQGFLRAAAMPGEAFVGLATSRK